MNKNRPFIIHPLLFALLPIITLFEHNKDLLKFNDTIRALIATFLLMLILYFFFGFILKSRVKTALATSLTLFLFFSFGHFVDIISPTFDNLYFYLRLFLSKLIPVLKPDYTFHYLIDYYVILFIWLILFVFLFFYIAKSKKKFTFITSFLNTTSFIIIIISLASISIFTIQSKNNSLSPISANAQTTKNVSNTNKNTPDIYYIILDAYGRADVLKKYYNFDNNNFLSQLKKNNFYIADDGHSNYPQTYLSMAATLNMEYLDNLAKKMGSESEDRLPLRKLIKDHAVYSFLKDQGYKFVALPFTWTGTYNNTKADLFIKRTQFNLSDFDELVIATTPLRLLYEKKFQLRNMRSKINFSFEQIPNIAKMPEPTFTYVHLLSPHPPFIFNEFGEPISPKGVISGLDGDHYFEYSPDVNKYRLQYVSQLKYINSRVEKMVAELLRLSPQDPIIIIQGDHGPGSMLHWEDPAKTNMFERLSILNAYHVPADTASLLYKNITPVNSFRIIFNSIFNANYKLLPDKSYFARWTKPYDFIDVTEKIKNFLNSPNLVD